MPTFKNPKDIAKSMQEQKDYFDYDPFIYDEELDDYDSVDYGKPENHYPSEYEPGYKEREDIGSQLTFYPTKKKDIYYLISDFMGDGFTTYDNVAKYIKGAYPYNKKHWDEEDAKYGKL